MRRSYVLTTRADALIDPVNLILETATSHVLMPRERGRGDDVRPRRGERGLCGVSILGVDGRVDHRDVFLSERQHSESRAMCACVSRVAGASVTIDC